MKKSWFGKLWLMAMAVCTALCFATACDKTPIGDIWDSYVNKESSSLSDESVEDSVEDSSDVVLKAEKVFILDASAAMHAEYEGITRFERAVEELREAATAHFQEDGIVSLIVSDASPEVVAERVDASGQDTFIATLDSLLNWWIEQGSHASADMKGALTLAEELTALNKNAEIVLFTGTHYTDCGDIEVVNVADANEWNVALLGAQAKYVDNYYAFEVELASYARDTRVEVYLEVQGANAADANDRGQTFMYLASLDCQANQTYKVVFIRSDFYEEGTFNQENTVYCLMENEGIYSFQDGLVYINVEDSFSYDNSVWLYGGAQQTLRVQCACDTVNGGNCILDTMYLQRDEWKDYWDMQIMQVRTGDEPALYGYDFYIFEGQAVTELPDDGVTFLINPTVSGEGFTLGEMKVWGASMSVTFDKSHPITEDFTEGEILDATYTTLESYDESFTPIMWCGEDPICLVKDTPTEKVVLLLLDIAKFGEGINQEITEGMVNNLLVGEVVEYFFPKTMERPIFEVGEEIVLTARGENLTVEWYDKSEVYTAKTVNFTPDIPGVYTVKQTTMSGQEVVEDFFVKIPRKESNIFRAEVLPKADYTQAEITVSPEKYCHVVKVAPAVGRVHVAEETTLRVFMNSTYEGAAVFILYQNGRMEKNIPINLVCGSQMVEIPCVFTEYGKYTFAFEIIGEDGTRLAKMSDFSASVELDDEEDILIFERNDGEAEVLLGLLATDYSTTVCNIFESFDLESLYAYDQVILVNIANADMPEGLDEALHTYVYEYGGSMVTVGGDDENGEANTYDRTDMYGTLYQEMLPVTAINYTPPVGVVFIIDRSGSMAAGVAGTTNLDAAKAGIASALDSLSERDYIGIITMESYSEVILDLTPRTEGRKIVEAIHSIGTAAGSTEVPDAIELAGRMLASTASVGKRHIVMITDGGVPESQRETYEALIRSNYDDYGITHSIVGIGMSEADRGEMQYAVELGHGRLHIVKDTAQLIKSLRDDLNAPEITEVVKEKFPLSMDATWMDFYSISAEDLFALQGFYGTKIKTDAEAVLTGVWGVPIYAQWKYGKGIVGSLTCNLTSDWCQELWGTENGQRLLRALICGAFSAPNTTVENHVSYEVPIPTTIAFPAVLSDGETIEVELLDGENMAVDCVVLTEKKDLDKTLTLAAPQSGDYTIKITKKDADGNVILQETLTVKV